jgi:ribosomal protection tetracycline resistance protein
MKILNIGILAHVDAGKTTLTESMLYTSGTIARSGRVDSGSTITDSMELEKQKGITIQASIASYQWNHVWHSGTNTYSFRCNKEKETSCNNFYQ